MFEKDPFPTEMFGFTTAGVKYRMVGQTCLVVLHQDKEYIFLVP